MEAAVKQQLAERNARIINAVIKKAEKVCPGAVALIGIAGSFQSGDIYDKSDLDLCIVSNDDRAWQAATCFILEDVAFDLYCTPWSRLEKMAEYNDPHVAKLLHLDIVYCPDDKDMQKYMNLRSLLTAKLNQAFSSEDNSKAQKYVDEAAKEYANIMLSDEFGQGRYSAAGMLLNIEYALYLYNKAYIKRGVKRIPQEICALNHLPIDFSELYWRVIKAASAEEIKQAATLLMKAVKIFAQQMKDKVTEKKEISQADLAGSYEEIHSNWKNKMYHAADTHDSYLALMTAASCQRFLYDEMHSMFKIDRIDLMNRIPADNLVLAAEVFSEAMEEYKLNYDKVGLKVKWYQNLTEFEQDYLE